MNRPFCSLALVLWTALCVAQGDTSLTREFSQLSAKERARIAKREQEEAAKDTRYQAVMVQAEDLFQHQRYDESLARFTEARGIRPYNVYPKVKIQDLQALIAKRDAQRAALPDTTAEVEVVKVKPPSPVVLETLPVPPTTTIEAAAAPPAPEPKEVPPVVHPVPEKPRPVPHPTDTVRSRTQPNMAAPKLPDGISERTYKEGRAIVIERQVVADGKMAIYKKVTHPWGEPVHFKDGIAIPARVWNEAFGDR